MDNIGEAIVTRPNLSWKQLDIDKKLKEIVLKEFKFNKMTPVQSATIPLMMANKDVIVEAKTGSGKTLAFIIPILQIVMARSKQTTNLSTHDVLAVIVSPTRELARQIFIQLNTFTKKPLLNNEQQPHIKTQLIVGGSDSSVDINKYEKFGANVIVATPGRLADLLERPDNRLAESIRKQLAIFILDEADQLLTLGFEKDISSILSYLPKQRRTGLFSATQTKQLDQLSRSGLRNPVRVNMNKEDNLKKDDTKKMVSMPDKLENFYQICDTYAQKLVFLLKMLEKQPNSKILVFMSTCAQVDYFAQSLTEFTSTIKPDQILKLHRKLKNKRKAIFDQFKKRKHCILLATDLLSRGIDVQDISWVIHLDLPESLESYVHRSGRSGHQINISGNSLLLLENHELDYIEMCKRKDIKLNQLSDKLAIESQYKCTQNLLENMKATARKDAKYYELGMQAFVSYLRFYSTKLCLRKLLYPKLDIVQLAKSFGLLKVPKMPELKNSLRRIMNDFQADADDLKICHDHTKLLHPDGITKKKKQQNNDGLDEEFESCRVKNQSCKEREKLKKLKGKRQKRAVDDYEFDELSRDNRMVKKLKKGKISDAEFDAYFNL